MWVVQEEIRIYLRPKHMNSIGHIKIQLVILFYYSLKASWPLNKIENTKIMLFYISANFGYFRFILS